MTVTASGPIQSTAGVHLAQDEHGVRAPAILVSGPTKRMIPFVLPGAVSVKAGEIAAYPRAAGRIERITASVADQVSGATVVDVLLNDVSVFTDNAHKPRLDQVGRHFADASQIDVAEFGPEAWIRVAVEQAGGGAIHLNVTVDYVETSEP